MEFNIYVKSNLDHKWYYVTNVSFRNWNNYPDNDVNVLSVEGHGKYFTLDPCYIEDIKFNIFREPEINIEVRSITVPTIKVKAPNGDTMVILFTQPTQPSDEPR